MSNKSISNDPRLVEQQEQVTQTRERLSREVDEIESRMSAENAKETAKEMAKDAVASTKTAVRERTGDAMESVRGGAREISRQAGRVRFDPVGAMRAFPVATALSAAGVGYLLYRSFELRDDERHRDYAPGAYGQIYPRDGESADHQGGIMYTQGGVAPAGEANSHSAEEGQTNGAPHHERGSGESSENRALAQKSREVMGAARRGSRNIAQQTERTYQDQAWAFGLGAAILGCAVGALIPTTEKEDELLGPRRERLATSAGDRLEDVAEAASRQVHDKMERAESRLAPKSDNGSANPSSPSV